MIKDNVNHPEHYNHNGIETIDVIEAWLTPEQFKGCLAGNVIKYVSRWQDKNGLEDLKKAKWYLEKLISKLDIPEKVGESEKEEDLRTGTRIPLPEECKISVADILAVMNDIDDNDLILRDIQNICSIISDLYDCLYLHLLVSQNNFYDYEIEVYRGPHFIKHIQFSDLSKRQLVSAIVESLNAEGFKTKKGGKIDVR